MQYYQRHVKKIFALFIVEDNHAAQGTTPLPAFFETTAR
jgi:hypothetical protein